MRAGVKWLGKEIAPEYFRRDDFAELIRASRGRPGDLSSPG
jgi:hypothetical protein